jgi:methylglyoxal synthase
VAPVDKRKELIEWSYDNKEMLSGHELIATAFAAELLEGTVNKNVFKLPAENIGGYNQLAAMMQNNQVDVIFFFENPLRNSRYDNNLNKLLDIALEMNIVIAGTQSKIDFMHTKADLLRA